MNSIGIIGAGNIGRAFATALAKNNIRATLANSRGPESLKDVVAVRRAHGLSASRPGASGPTGR